MTAANPWIETYPLSLTEIRRLTWLRSKIEARVHLGQTQEHVSIQEAARLAFARHLAASHRISEWIGVQP